MLCDWSGLPFSSQCQQILTKSSGVSRAIAQAVSRRLPTATARVQTRVWSCGILWWTKVALGQVFSSENFGLFPLHNLHSICFSTITRGWHNRPGVAAVPIASQFRIKKKKRVRDCTSWNETESSSLWKILFLFFFYFCQFTIYWAVKEVISKCDTRLRLVGSNFPTAVLIHLICYVFWPRTLGD
jgi:hypothetical protein